MRWKTQILASVVMAALAVLLYLAVGRLFTGTFEPASPLPHPLRLTNLALLIPAAAASFFVYRHTPRERKTQAVITFLLTVALSIATLVVINRFL
jgi:hypothetical protein